MLLCIAQLLDAIEDEVLQGGCLLDWHACDLFPKSWVDLVVVLRCPSTSVHYDRLSTRYFPSEWLFGYTCNVLDMEVTYVFCWILAKKIGLLQRIS